MAELVDDPIRFRQLTALIVKEESDIAIMETAPLTLLLEQREIVRLENASADHAEHAASESLTACELAFRQLIGLTTLAAPGGEVAKAFIDELVDYSSKAVFWWLRNGLRRARSAGGSEANSPDLGQTGSVIMFDEILAVSIYYFDKVGAEQVVIENRGRVVDAERKHDEEWNRRIEEMKKYEKDREAERESEAP